MKKIFILLLILCLLLGASAFAYFQFFSTPTPPELFTLRNGYHWGMTKEEALALAVAEGLPKPEERNPEVVFGNVPLGENWTSSFHLLFDENLLLSGIGYASNFLTLEEYTSMIEFFARSIESKYNVQPSTLQPPPNFSALSEYTFELPDTIIYIGRVDDLSSSLNLSGIFNFVLLYVPIEGVEIANPTTPPANYGI